MKEIKRKVFVFNSETTEWCPHCEEEVELLQSIQHCPNCDVIMLACSMCDIKKCGTCRIGTGFKLHPDASGIEITKVFKID